MRASRDVTFKLLSGKLAGVTGDMILHACEVDARSCPASSDDRLLLHFDRFRRLDASDPANQLPSPRGGAADVEEPPAGPTGRGRGAGDRSLGACARPGGAPVFDASGPPLDAGAPPPAGDAVTGSGEAAAAIRQRLHDLKAKWGDADGSRRPAPAAGRASKIADVLRERAANFDTSMADRRLPGPRPGDRRSGAAQAQAVVTDDAGDVEGGGASLFRLAPTRAANDDDIVAFARAHPGQLLGLAVEEVDRFLATREGASDSAAAGVAASRFVSYLTSIFHAAHPPAEVGERASGELRTLAEALDALTRGDFARVGDLLTQRFKSVELQASGATATLARQRELIPPSRVGLAREGELTVAARSELMRAKLEEIAKGRSS